MTRHRYKDDKIRELKQEIEMLKQSIDISLELYNDLKNERVSYRRLIKYNTVLMLLMNLITSNSGDTDIGRVLKRNIHEFYISMNKDLMKIPNDDNEYEAEGYDEGESTDSWDDAEEEFE